jgi:hypothetical protein
MEFGSGQVKRIINEQREWFVRQRPGTVRELLSQMDSKVKLPHAVVIHGLRRAGKSTLMKQIAEKYYEPEDYYFLNFEDERLLNIEVTALNQLYQYLMEEYGRREVFFLDEIQHIDGWEKFVRRLHDRGMKFYLTGSNAYLQESTWAQKLTGRHQTLGLLPFSFAEYLRFHEHQIPARFDSLTTEQTAQLRAYFDKYLRFGGVPLYWKYNDIDLLADIYHDVIFRDVISCNGIQKIDDLRELALYLLSNVSGLFTYNNLANRLGISSTETVRQFISYLKESWLFHSVKKFDYSVARQRQNPRKIYCVDNGLIEATAFRFSEDRGRYLENLVFLELKRRNQEVFYYKTSSGKEVDFLVRRGTDIKSLIQVAYEFENQQTIKREFEALQEGMEELDVKQGLILTADEKSLQTDCDKNIAVEPVWKWLLKTKDKLNG